MKYRLTDIKNFVATSTCTTIIQAAKKLEISQPALSESLKRLESDLGYVLFYRSRSGIKLTPSGKIFLTRAHVAMQAFSDLDIAHQGEAIFGGRTMTIGCHATVAQYSVPKALAYLKEKAPDYKIELRHDLSRNIQTDIQRGFLDIGIVINPTSVPDIVIQKLDTDLVAVWATKASAEMDTVICNLNLFQTQSILKRWKNKPMKVISTDSLELIARLADEGIGYGILPERAVMLSKLALKQVTNLPTFKDEICLVYRPEFGRNPAEKLMIEAFKKSISSKF